MTADPALVTARISGPGFDGGANSPWAGIADKLQTATLGEFQIIRELGRGGMAAVYLAHDIHLDRKVAIKVMSPMLASDDRMVERFRREAKTGAGLKHPNIGTVHRVLEGEGLYFFVMDFVRGRPLDAIIHRNGLLSVPVTRALLYQIGSGLAYAHRRKIYHRDVKPGNVLVSAADGTAVVTDFGIAKVAESPTQTQTGAIVGTPAYMAPEQILAREITGAVDQYALGCMAYEMLTGAPPFVGTSFVVMHAHTELQPRSIRESRPDCPPELDEAILRMLAKDPNSRWPTLPHALAAMGATMIGEDDPIREELIYLATPNETENARYATNTPLSPPPPTVNRGALVAMVAISPPPERIEVGDTFRLTASPRDQHGAEIGGVPIDWATTNESVLQIATDGSVTAVSPGAVEISATAGRARGAVLVSVEPGRVSTVQLSIPPGVLMAGDRIQLGARVMDKHQRPLGYAVRWGVADPNIARITPEGVLEARAPGSVEVYVESNGVRTAMRVQIAPTSVATIQLSHDPQRPVVGDRIRVSATPVDAHGRPLRDRAIGWSLSDPALVVIQSDGVYEAKKSGRLRVTAASEGIAASVDVLIAPAPVAAVNVSPPPHQVVPGQTFKLDGLVLDARGNVLADKDISWSCSAPVLAAVSDDGTVMALDVGDVRIIATCEGKSASVAVSIRSAPVASVYVTGVPQTAYVKAPFRVAEPVSVAAPPSVPERPAVDVSASAIFSPQTQPPIAPSFPSPRKSKERRSTPVVAPPFQTSEEPAKSGGKRGLLIGAGVGAIVVIGVVVAMMSGGSEPTAATPIETPPPTIPTVKPGDKGGFAVVASAETTAKRQPQTATTPAAPTQQAVQQRSNAKTITPPTRPVVAAAERPTAVVAAPEPPPRERDAFRVSVSTPPSLRVGDGATLRANVERTAGSGPTPTVTWESSRPTVLRVDPNTGIATAVGEGQSIVTAIAGGTRTDVTVNVAAAPAPAGYAAPAAGYAASTPKTDPPPRTGPSPEEIRSRAESALRDAPNGMAAALRARDAGAVGRLMADAQGADQAADLLKNLKDFVSATAAVIRVGTAQVNDRSATIDYLVDLKYKNQMGLERQRSLTMRAEAERSGDNWTIVRHRLLSGWK